MTRRDYDCLYEKLCELGKELPSVLRRHAGRIVQHNGGGKSVDNHVENRMKGEGRCRCCGHLGLMRRVGVEDCHALILNVPFINFHNIALGQTRKRPTIIILHPTSLRSLPVSRF